MSVPATNPTSPATPRLSEIPPTPQQSRGVAGANPKESHRSGRNRSVDCVAVSIPFLARGTVPFDQPDLASIRYCVRVWAEILGPVYALILIGVISSSRTAPHIGSRLQDKVAARRETIGVLVWPTNPEAADPFIPQHLTRCSPCFSLR